MSESYQGIPTFKDWLQQRQESEILSEFTRIDKSEIQDFMYGCHEIQIKLDGIKPDTVFFPERGARPIAWVLDELYGQIPYVEVPLPIGTGVSTSNNKWSGFSDAEKNRIIEEEVQRLAATGHVVQNPALIDEVQTGGTMSFVSTNLYNALGNTFFCDKLNVIAAKDDRNRNQPIKAKKLKQMISQRFPNLPTSLSLLSLFYIDRVNMLNIIVKDTQTLVQNKRAEAIFRLLTHISFPDTQNTNREVDLFEMAIDGITNREALTNFNNWIFQIKQDNTI